MITMDDLRKEFNLDVLKDEDKEMLALVEAKVREAASNDRDMVVIDVTEETYPKFFILNTRVGNLLTDSGYRVGLVKQEAESDKPERYGAMISFAGNR